jgi:hypothetical protein
MDEYAPMYNEIPPPYTFPPKTSPLTPQFANALLCRARLENETLSSCNPADKPA